MSEHLSWYIVPIIVAISVFILAAIVEFIARKNASINKLIRILKRGSFLSPTFLSIITGVLLIAGGFDNYLFAPGMQLNESTLSLILRIAQLVIGLGLVLGIFIRLVNVALLGCFIAGFFIFPAADILDYSIFAGIAVFLFLVHRDALSFSFFFHPIEKKELFDHYRRHALPILRFVAGATLAYAALHHNILDNSAAVAFVEAGPMLNIMQSVFGIEDYTHYWFVIHTGIFSILLGALLAFGLLERIVSIIIGIGLLISIFIGGFNFLQIVLPYFAVIYIIVTGNQFEDRERFAKA